ncbi:MAG: DegT/DnrJ/EryC1/StrS family aminotransferase, partial [Microbacterium sp.]|nr:DegT/DnrJ/EryC1/StrS family aminotransferase [Microbacterium sp.]
MADGAPAVPFLDLVSQQAEVADEVLAAWERLLRAAHFVAGPDVAAFEREFAAYIGVEHAVGVANGTDALELAYRALGPGGGYTSDLLAAVQQAIVDGVDVINYSVSGSASVYSDAVELAFLDAYAA